MFYAAENIIREIYTSTVRMRLLDTGIVHYSYLPNVDVHVEEHIENHHALVQLVGRVKHPILVDASELVNITSSAREKIKELEPISPTLARAFVTKSIGHKLLISFYMKVNKPHVENRIFSNYQEAVSWLMKLAAQPVPIANDRTCLNPI